MMRCWTLSLLAPLTLLLAASPLCADQTAESEPSREQLAFFEQHIRPLLAERCFKCHGEEKQKGGLRLDALNTMLAGGESGATVVPGRPDESLLIEAVRYESFEMPPDGQLSEQEIELLTKWVSIGAPWPAADRNVAVPTTGTITEDDRAWWAFQPLQIVEPPDVDDGGWSHNEIDRFIWRKLDENGLTPSPEADRLTLVRRLYQNLIGLPPTPEQIDAFLSDHSSDAYTRLVDELLESPRHGEHWATFWLDLVRYADSDGFKADHYRPHAWRYRDYVIAAFNADKPYDQFVVEQLAGDEFAPSDPQALAATGFLRHGIYEYNQRDAFTQWQDILNDITDTTADVFLGLGMGCARCHDHKFDPILQKDYYRLQAFFSGLGFRDDVPLAPREEVERYKRQLAAWEAKTAALREQINTLERPKLDKLAAEMIATFPPETQAIMAKPADERSAHERQIAHLVDLQVIDRQQRLATKFSGEEKEKWESLKSQLAEFDDEKPKPLPGGQTISDVDRTAAAVFIPGKERLGEIAPGFLSVLDESSADYAPLPTSPNTTGRRAAFARWLVRADHPLTARVIVNRIWQQHFGTGLVATASDFGRLGERPSHPELLDWLAMSFIENGWSLKWLHRQIAGSRTYRQSSVVEPSRQALRIDPANRLLWRQNVRRLTAEQIRDAALLVSGQLQITEGGPPQEAALSKRRTVYTKVLRNSRDALLDVFDLPDRITGTAARNVTTTPAQSLLMINSDRILKQAEAFARRLEKELPGGVESQLRLAYRLAYGRDPSEDELRLPEQFLKTDEAVQSSKSITRVNMPGSGSAAVAISPEDDASVLEAPAAQPLPTDEFTVEALVQLHSLYEDATVRTIVSQWDSNNDHPGWSLGVTSAKSKYRPRNVILQLVGRTPNGSRTYEVIASNIHLELNAPYFVGVTVDLNRPTRDGVVFSVRRLGAAEATSQSVQVKHNIIGGYANSSKLVIGGRDGSTRHRWDGLIGEVRISARIQPESRFLIEDAASAEDVLGWWTFDDETTPLANSAPDGLPLGRYGETGGASSHLVDLCHVIFNSNEFLYVD